MLEWPEDFMEYTFADFSQEKNRLFLSKFLVPFTDSIDKVCRTYTFNLLEQIENVKMCSDP